MLTRLCRLYGKHDIQIETARVEPPKAGEVLVQIGAGGICGSDLHYYHDGGFGPVRVQEPIILGHEVAGVVHATGPGVNRVKIGDKVALNPSQPCGDCTFCKTGLFHHCLTMRFFGSAMRLPHEQGAFRDRMIVSQNQCVPVSAQTTLAQAACAEPLAVCLHARHQAPDLNGRRVLVSGAGPIGALCAALAAQAGAAEIVATDLQDMPLSVARNMNATRGINMRTHPETLAAYAADKGYFDVAFECSAAAPALRAALDVVRPQGTVVQVGVAGDIPVPLNVLVSKEIKLIGTHRFHAEFAQAVAMIDSGALDVRPIITATYPLVDAVAAFDIAGDRSRSVKVQLSFEQPG